MKATFHRRRLLHSNAAAAGAIVAPCVVPCSVLGKQGAVPPGERTTLAFLGPGNRGRGLMKVFVLRPEVETVAISDRPQRPLRYDPVKVEFPDDDEANRPLDTPKRAPWRIHSASAATIDRLLSPIRKQARGGKKRRTSAKRTSKQIPIRTFADWKEVEPGFLEIDFVAHCGGSMAGSFIHSLVATDVCSG